MQTFSPPLKCNDCPDNELFTKVSIRRTKIDSRGKTPHGAKPSTIEVMYVCDECQDIIKKEPLHTHRSIKR